MLATMRGNTAGSLNHNMPSREIRMVHFGRKSVAAVALVLAFAIPSSAANARALFAYPLKGQSVEQENLDRLACHDWAVTQTGFNPSGYPEETKGYRGARKGLFVGGATGTIVGAIAKGGTGALVGLGAGAAAGGLIGGIFGVEKQRKLDLRYDAYLRAAETCLRGKGYQVSR